MHLSSKILLIASTLLFSGIAVANNDCQHQPVCLQVLGSGGPELDDQRASTSYLIWVDGKATVLIDTGTGSAVNFERTAAQFEDLQAILFTHLHVDHSADLPAFIKGAYFTPRTQDLPIYGPAGNALMPATTVFIDSLFGKQGAFRYLSNFVDSSQRSAFHIKPYDVPLTPHEVSVYKINDNLTLKAIPTHHGPIASIAWRVEVQDHAITFSGDMNNDYHTLAILAENTDILVAHNAIPESATGVGRFLHMPPSDIGQIAQQANAKQLVLSHRMNRTLNKTAETLRHIQKSYHGTIHFADDLDLFPAAAMQK